MKADLKVTVSSPDIPLLNSIKPVGLTLSYGINELPTSSLDLSTEDMALFCDYTAWKRKPIKVIVFSKNGCLQFDGLADGLSTSCSVGSMSTQLVIKHPFQILFETYPRTPGFHPGSEDILNMTPVMSFKNAGNNWFLNLYGTGVPTYKQNPIKYVIDLAIFMLENQQRAVNAYKPRTNANFRLASVIAAVSEYTPALFKKSIALLNSIDTTRTDGMNFISNGNHANVLISIFSNLAENTSSVLDFVISGIKLFKCNLIIAFDKAYTVPNAGFLIQEANTNIVGKSTTPNIAYPADYSSYQFSDNGFKDIKGVYVYGAATGMAYGRSVPSIGEGAWVDPDPLVKGGIAMANIPLFSFYAFDSSASTAQVTTPPTGAVVPGAAAVKGVSEQTQATRDATSQEFYDNWAQMTYFELKYMDRTGSLNSMFNPRWAPGAVGTIYTKQPGAFIDMFVTGVTHTFSISAPNTGIASTSVSFTCGRFGKSRTGMSSIRLFKFDAGSSLAYAADFVNNISI